MKLPHFFYSIIKAPSIGNFLRSISPKSRLSGHFLCTDNSQHTAADPRAQVDQSNGILYQGDTNMEKVSHNKHLNTKLIFHCAVCSTVLVKL